MWDAFQHPQKQAVDTWRIEADTSSSGWAFDVKRLKFLTVSNEEIGPSTPGCQTIESASVDVPGYGPENAFRSQDVRWGGRKNDKGIFFIGIACAATNKIASVELEQGSGHFASEVRVIHNDMVVATAHGVQPGRSILWQAHKEIADNLM